jgi:hypothetical protein
MWFLVCLQLIVNPFIISVPSSSFCPESQLIDGVRKTITGKKCQTMRLLMTKQEKKELMGDKHD